MKIKDTWEAFDPVIGLRLTVKAGKKLDTLHIEHIGKPICNNRDFFFGKDGHFDGTGSSVG